MSSGTTHLRPGHSPHAVGSTLMLLPGLIVHQCGLTRDYRVAVRSRRLNSPAAVIRNATQSLMSCA